MDELAEDDKILVQRARKIQRFLSQPFFVAEVFTGKAGKYVKIEDTIKGFDELISGKLDHIPEQFFYMVGGLEEVLENYALYRLMQDDELDKDDDEVLTGENAKAFYQAQKKRYEG